MKGVILTICVTCTKHYKRNDRECTHRPMMLRLLLYTCAFATAYAQSAVCERGYCAGYAIPKTSFLLFTKSADGATFIFDDPVSQCAACAVAWKSETVAQGSNMYNAFRCPICCYDYTTCYQVCARRICRGNALELGSAQTRSWRTASSGFAELCKTRQIRRAHTW